MCAAGVPRPPRSDNGDGGASFGASGGSDMAVTDTSDASDSADSAATARRRLHIEPIFVDGIQLLSLADSGLELRTDSEPK